MSSAKQAVIQPYLFFGGRCDEALEFYTRALGAKVEMVMRFDESPTPAPPGTLKPGFEHKVMHSQFTVGGATVMASDGCGPGPGFAGFSLSLALPAASDVDRVFGALAEGGKVGMPPGKTFWSERFGMVTDKFGVGWMVTVEPKA